MKCPQNTNRRRMHPVSRLKSILCALNGLRLLIKQEPNAKVHALATIIVLIAGWLRRLHPWQWIALFVAIALVWITEAINTCIERLCDAWCNREYHPEVGFIKDVAAGAVLVAAIASIGIGLLVFLS